MWLNLLTILGTCVAVAVSGFFVYWLIIKIKKTLRANRFNSTKGEKQTPLTIAEDIDDQSLKEPLNEADYVPDIRREPDKTEDDDWLNNGVLEASASTIKKADDDWLNAGLEDVPTNIYKQQDDDWLNADCHQPSKTADESSLNHATTNRPEIQIKQDGSILNITVTSKKQDIQPKQTVINLKINLPPQDLARKGDGPYDIEITTDDSPPSFQSLQDIITAKPVEDPGNPGNSLLDEITIRPVENQITGNHALMDEITVRPAASPVHVSLPLMDEITIRPVENQVAGKHALMDEVTVRPAAGPVNIEYELLDDLITKSAIYRTKKVKPSDDSIITNPVESPVEKAEPLETLGVDEITEILNEQRDFKQATIPLAATGLRSTLFFARMGEGIGNLLGQAKNLCKKTKLQSKSVLAQMDKETATLPDQDKSLYKKAVLPDKPILTPMDKETTATLPDQDKGLYKKTALPDKPILAPMDQETTAILPDQDKGLYKKSAVHKVLAKVLATFRLYNNNEFYVQDTNLTNLNTMMQKPQIKALTFKVLNTTTELDDLIDSGYDLVMNFNTIKRCLEKGMVAFLTFVDGELASIGWACMTERSKATFKDYPYNDDLDLDEHACIVGDWTNPKFRDSGIPDYVKQKRQQLLKEKGFTFERSIVEESIVKDLRSIREQNRFAVTYKRRTYTNVSLPGILGVEFWKEHPLNETDTRPTYQMLTLLILALPSPPRWFAGLNIKPRVLKLNLT